MSILMRKNVRQIDSDFKNLILSMVYITEIKLLTGQKIEN